MSVDVENLAGAVAALEAASLVVVRKSLISWSFFFSFFSSFSNYNFDPFLWILATASSGIVSNVRAGATGAAGWCLWMRLAGSVEVKAILERFRRSISGEIFYLWFVFWIVRVPVLNDSESEGLIAIASSFWAT